MAPCSRFGKVRQGAVQVHGVAEVIANPATVERLTGIIRRKYGVEFFIVTFIERLLARGSKPRVILRVALSS
jgi:hypothetical protein